MNARLSVLLCVCGAVACSTTPTSSAADAGVPVNESPTADASADAAGWPILPYPPGPYGGGMGDVIPDFRIQGIALSRSQRDPSKLVYRDVSLAEVRSDPACACLVLLRNAIACPPGERESKALVSAMADDPTLCAMEVIDSNFNGISPADNIHPPTRADIEDYTRAGRQNFPVGILTQGGNLALTAGAIGIDPFAYVVSPKDMRLIGFFAGLPRDFRATLSAFCKQGPLNPVETLANGVSPRRLLIDSTHAYLSDYNAGILRVPLGGGAPVSIAKPVSTPDAIALDSSRVCWATHEDAGNFEVGCVPKVGGTPLVLASGSVGYFGVATDGQSAYFTRADGVVASVPLGGGPVTILSSNESQPTKIAVDATDVFWIESGSGAVVRAPKTGGARSVVVTSAALTLGNAPRDFVLDGDEVVVLSDQSNERNGSIDRIPKVGGAVRNVDQWIVPTTLAMDPKGALLFGSRDPTVENFGIVAVCRTLGAPEIITPGQRNVTGIAGDGDNVYWITNDDDVRANGGALKRARRLAAGEVPP